MATSEILLGNNVPDSDKVSTEKCNNSEKLLENHLTTTQPILNNGKVLKKTKKSKKTNLDKRKQETQKNEQVKTRNGNKSSDEDNKQCIPLPDNELCIDEKLIKTRSSVKTNKENQIKNISKNKAASSSHKLTEYFSELKVHEHKKNSAESVNLKNIQSENNQICNKNLILSSTQTISDNSLQSPGKKLRQRKARLNVEKTNHKVTEYFQVRRSERKYKWDIMYEEQKNLYNKILNQVEDGLKIVEIENKGRGLITTKEFRKGDFVVEYIGELIDKTTAEEREIKYAKNKSIGCYMYYFCHKNKKYCIDATAESGKLGRLINHSRKEGNLISRIIELNEIPRLILFAKTEIPIGTELLYDYGDRRRETIENNPWLNS